MVYFRIEPGHNPSHTSEEVWDEIYRLLPNDLGSVKIYSLYPQSVVLSSKDDDTERLKKCRKICADIFCAMSEKGLNVSIVIT